MVQPENVPIYPMEPPPMDLSYVAAKAGEVKRQRARHGASAVYSRPHRYWREGEVPKPKMTRLTQYTATLRGAAAAFIVDTAHPLVFGGLGAFQGEGTARACRGGGPGAGGPRPRPERQTPAPPQTVAGSRLAPAQSCPTWTALLLPQTWTPDQPIP